MKLYSFSNEEIKKMEDTLKGVLEDARNIYNLAQVDCLEVHFDMFNDGNLNWKIRIDNDSIYLLNEKFETRAGHCLESFCEVKQLFRKTERRKVSANINNRYMADRVFRFLSNYEMIREKMVKKAKRTSQEKDTIFKTIEDLRIKYCGDVIIDLDLPLSQNMHELGLKNNNGKKIGIIKFGNRTINVIAGSNIIFRDKEKSKVKTKEIT